MKRRPLFNCPVFEDATIFSKRTFILKSSATFFHTKPLSSFLSARDDRNAR